MDTSPTSPLEFEKETPESLLPVLAESGQVVPAIKVIFDRDWRSEYSSILEKCASTKKDEIETICNDNYSDFIDAIDQLLSVQLSVNDLQTKIDSLNTSIQGNGSNLRSKIENLLILKQTRRNMDITINKLNRLKYILQLMDKIRDMMSKKKYISALKNLNQLSSHHLIQLQEYTVSRKIWDSLPSLREKITKQVNSNFDEWMHSINKQSKELGKLAFHQTKTNIEQEEEERYLLYTPKMDDIVHSKSFCDVFFNDRENLAANENDGDTQLQQIQLQQKFGLFIGDNNNDSNQQKFDNMERKQNESNISTLFEKIENLDFNAIYQCIHIHETQGSIDGFVTRYAEQRKQRRLKILNEALINPNYKKQEKKKSIINKAYFYNLCGFYVIEHAVSSRYQQLANQEEVQNEWDQSCKKLTKRISSELLTICKLPKEFIDIKNNVFILSKAILNYDFRINHIMGFLEDLRLKFEQRLVIMLQKNVQKILEKDKFRAFTVQNIDDFECIAAYNLDVAIDGNKELKERESNIITINLAENEAMDDAKQEDEDQYYKESDFPMTVPFSVSVPMICGYLDDFISYYEDYSRYLSDMSSFIRQAVENAIKNVVCAQIKQVVSSSQEKKDDLPNQNPQFQKLQSTETQRVQKQFDKNSIGRKLQIGELAQLAVNASYLEKSCKFFERELATEDQINYDDANDNNLSLKDNDDPNSVQIPKMHEARDALNSVLSQCVDALFERLQSEVDNILNKYMPKINWVSDKINNNIHEWVYKLLEFLDSVLQSKIKYLPEQYRDSAYFITMARINTFITNLFQSTENNAISIKKWNIISMYNFNLDIIRLETYSRQTLIRDLVTIFRPLRQLLNLLLCGREIVQYTNDEIRMEKYMVVQTQHVRVMLEKYKTLGVFNKLPRHIKNLEKKTVQRMLKDLRDMD